MSYLQPCLSRMLIRIHIKKQAYFCQCLLMPKHKLLLKTFMQISNSREMQLTLLRVSSKEPMVFLQYNTDVPQLWSLSDFTCVHLDKNIWGNEGRRKSESLVSSVQGNTCTPRHTIEQHLSISSLYAFFVSSMYL